MAEGRGDDDDVAQKKEAVVERKNFPPISTSTSTSTLIPNNQLGGEDVVSTEEAAFFEKQEEEEVPRITFSRWGFLDRLQAWAIPLTALMLVITIAIVVAMTWMLKTSFSSSTTYPIPGEGYSGTVDPGVEPQDLLNAFLNSSKPPPISLVASPSSGGADNFLPHNINNGDDDSNNTTSKLITSCGSTRTSAIALGCIFDVMATAWTPPLCHDAPLAASAIDPSSTLAAHKAAGIYRWYSDRAFTHPIDQSLVYTLEQNYAYTISRFHTAHCLYMTRLIARALDRLLTDGGEKNVYLPRWTVEKKHNEHCNLVLANEDTPPISPVQVFFIIGECVRLDGGHDIVKESAASASVEPT